MSIDDHARFCLSAATLFIASCAHGQPDASANAPTRVKCLGINSCAGQGECAAKASDGTELNACGGQNTCSAKGWVEVDQTECQQKGGEVLEVVQRTTTACVSPSAPRLPSEQAQEHYNLDRDTLGIEGYDPVAYFPEGGGTPAAGRPELTHVHGGVTYRFVSEDNRARFKADPERYEPVFGGWCAYAMGKTGRKVKVDPEAFLIEQDQLLLFYRTRTGDTRDKWKDDPQDLRIRADRAWSERTGECRAEAPAEAPPAEAGAAGQ